MKMQYNIKTHVFLGRTQHRIKLKKIPRNEHPLGEPWFISYYSWQKVRDKAVLNVHAIFYSPVSSFAIHINPFIWAG